MTYLEEYDKWIQSGEYIVSERLKQYIHTLTQESKADEWVYDTDEAHTRIRFQEQLVKQSKGSYTGQTIQLCLWQKAFWEVVYSFKHKDTGRRRFNEVLLLVARKNGKSTMMAGDAMVDLLIGKGVSIACLSNDDKQAKLIWTEIENIRSQIDTNNKLTGKNLSEIYNRKNFNKIFRLTSSMTNLDGANISKAYFDEAHECLDDAIYQAGSRSMSAQDDPLMIIVTTNGFVRDKFLDDKINLAHDIMDGYVDKPDFLAWLYEMDSESEIWDDPTSWQKANPSLIDGIKKQAYMERVVENAKLSIRDRVHCLTKDFNIAKMSSEQFLSEDQLTYLQKLGSPEGIPSDESVIGVGAVDLSQTTDVTCACYLYRLPDDRNYYTLQHYWIPKSKLLKGNDDASAGADYLTWEKEGWITITDEVEVNAEDVATWFSELADKGFETFCVGYDKWNSYTLKKKLDALGYENQPIRQGFALSNSLFILSDLCENHELHWENNPITTWMLSNLNIKADGDGNIRPVKGKTKSARIDGAVTLAMALQTYRDNKDEMDEVHNFVGVQIWE